MRQSVARVPKEREAFPPPLAHTNASYGGRAEAPQREGGQPSVSDPLA